MSLSTFQRADKQGRAHAARLEDDLAEQYRLVCAWLVYTMIGNLTDAQPVTMTVASEPWTPPDADELASLLTLIQKLTYAGETIRADALKRVMHASLEPFGVSFSVRNPLVEGVLEGQGQKITRIAESLRADVMAQINQAWQDGLSIPETAALIRQAAPEFTASRARTIARTEIVSVSNGGSLAAARITGAAESKTWLATEDARTRDDHAEADGQTVPLDQPFIVGGEQLDYPGDPNGSPGEIINCRCTVVYDDSVTAGGAMSTEPDTLATVTISYQGQDYHLPDGEVTPAALRALNPGITDDVVAALCALPPLTAAASGSTSLPLGARDETWSASAAEAAMNGAAQLAAMHFWKDPQGDPATKAAYKLPFATPEGGSHAVWAGVTASAAAIQGSRGGVSIPAADVPGVKAKIEAYYKAAATRYKDDTIKVPWDSGAASVDGDAYQQVEAHPYQPMQPGQENSPCKVCGLQEGANPHRATNAATLAAAGTWTAEPLIPYGKLTRDGRMIRAGSLSWPGDMPVPLMSMLEDVHGPSMSLPPSQLAGAIDSYADTPDGMNATGRIDATPAGQAAMAAAEDGRMGISADLAVTEYEFVMSQDVMDADEASLQAGDAPSQDVPGGIVVEDGDLTDMGVMVVTGAQVMGCTIVPFAAWDDARIAVTAVAADGSPTRMRVTAPITITAAAKVVPIRMDAEPVDADLDAVAARLRIALDLRVATVNDAREALGLRRVQGGDVYVGTGADTGVSELAEADGPMLAALEAMAAQMRASSGAAAVETLIASMRRSNGQKAPGDVDLVELVKAVGESSRNPELVASLQALIAHAGRQPEPVERTTVINPPPITVHTPDVHVENHQPDVHVTAGGQPKQLVVERDEHGHAVSYRVAD